MSFADSVREELQGVPVRRACCKRALAAGLLIDADVQGQQLLLPCRSPSAAAYAAEVIRRQFGKAPELREEIVRRHRSVRLVFSSPAAGGLVRLFETVHADAKLEPSLAQEPADDYEMQAGASVSAAGRGAPPQADSMEAHAGDPRVAGADRSPGEYRVADADADGEARRNASGESGSGANEKTHHAENRETEPFPPEIFAPGCESCRSAFLRGAFLSVGTLNDPHRSTHFELTLRHPARAGFLAEFLAACGYPPGVIHRGDSVGLYYKDCASAEDLAALAGAGKSAMEMMNIRIEREIRNQENRATNCVAKNIEKSVSASARQMAAIEKLTLTGMLAQLPEPLRVTARLRAEHPDATLEELRLLHLPPITKSGLNHRLQKLIEAADKP